MNDSTLLNILCAMLGALAGGAFGAFCGERYGVRLGWARRGMHEMRQNSIAAQMRRDARGRFRKWPMPQRTFGDHLESSQHTKDL